MSPAIVSRPLAALLLMSLAGLCPAAERAFVGYYAVFGDLPVEQLPWDRLTHLCHAYQRLDADGEPVVTPAVPNPALTADGRRAGVPVLLTIGGGQTLRGLESATESEESTTALAKKLARIVYDGDYDGIDLAWEFPRNAATGAQHARLVLELRRLLDRLSEREQRSQRYLISAAVSPTPFFGQHVEAERIVAAVDWLSVMTYDMSGSWSSEAAHHAPLFGSQEDPQRDTRSVAAAMRYWETERGVPKDKLLLGLPMFGRSMPAAAPYAALDPALADQHRTLDFNVVRKRVGEGWPAKWDQQSRVPWLVKPTPKRPTASASPLTPLTPADDEAPAVIAYDDRNSIDLKATWAREQGYRGLFFWAVHQDRMPDGRHWLLDAAGKAWPAE